MTTTRASRSIDAPVETVFDTIAHIENFQKAVPHILDVEFLSETRRGVGAKFRETRAMGRRKASTELEVTEYVENDRIRLVTDTGGTIWDSLFTVKAVGDDGSTDLLLEMDARPHKLLAKLTVPLFKPLVARGVNADMDAVKAYCEELS